MPLNLLDTPPPKDKIFTLLNQEEAPGLRVSARWRWKVGRFLAEAGAAAAVERPAGGWAQKQILGQ